MYINHVCTHMLLVAKELAAHLTLEMVIVAMFHIAVIAQWSKRVKHLVAGHTHALLVNRTHVIQQLGVHRKCVLTQRTGEGAWLIVKRVWKSHGFRRLQPVVSSDTVLTVHAIAWLVVGTTTRLCHKASFRVEHIVTLREDTTASLGVRNLSRWHAGTGWLGMGTELRLIVWTGLRTGHFYFNNPATPQLWLIWGRAQDFRSCNWSRWCRTFVQRRIGAFKSARSGAPACSAHGLMHGLVPRSCLCRSSREVRAAQLLYKPTTVRWHHCCKYRHDGQWHTLSSTDTTKTTYIAKGIECMRCKQALLGRLWLLNFIV